MKKIAFLITNPNALTPEEQAAWAFVSGLKAFRAEKVLFSSIARNTRQFMESDIAWWHFDASASLPEAAMHQGTIDAIRTYLANGSGLLLTLASAQYVVELGLDSTRPNICAAGTWQEPSWADGYPDMRGFGAHGPHPIFKGFSGGLFAWAPVVGQRYAAAFYEDELPASGKVVAVEKLYIKLNEQRRNIVEYNQCAGQVLTIGSHFYFADAGQQFRKQLELFASNCFAYLGTEKSQRDGLRNQHSYWYFNPPGVIQFAHRSKPLSVGSQKLPHKPDNLVIRRDFLSPGLTEQFFDLSGQRVLAMGGERGGISEVWCHPVRTLENIKLRFQVGSAAPRWSHELTPVITIQAECLSRRYELNEAVIEETVFADQAKPCCAIHFRIKAKQRVQIVLSAKSDLRLMWPLSERATGSLRYAWDERLHAGIISDASGCLSSIVGVSLNPKDYLLGQFSEVTLENDNLKGIPSEKSEVALGLRLALNPGMRECTFALAGSGESLQESIQAYRSIIRQPGASLRKQFKHFKLIAKTAVQVITPNEHLNQAYRWALSGLEKLLVETPGLGRSFAAGYGLSSEGWNGGHAVSGRPGYAWYFGRDSVWISLAVLAAGEYETVRRVLEFLGDHQDVDGKILHELTTSGHAHFDAADATPLYLILMGRYVSASGDLKLAAREFPRMLKAIEYCYSTDSDKDHLIENTNVGHGWVEGGELFPSHAEHYLNACWAEALLQSALIAGLLRKEPLAKKWKRESDAVRTILRRDFWNQQTGFYNFAKHRNGSYSEEPTVLPSVGMYLDCTEIEKSSRSLVEYAGDKFSADWGVRIVSKESRMYKPTGYHYGSIWPLFTGWTSLAEFASRRPIQGYMHLLGNALLYDQFSAGNTEEVLHGELFQPAGVCPHQGWSQSMVIQPLVEGMLGLNVDAFNRSVHLSPYFPPNWKHARINNLRVGDHRLNVTMQRKGTETVYTFSLRDDLKRRRSVVTHTLMFRPFFPLGTRIDHFTIGGDVQKFSTIVNNYDKLPSVRIELGRKTTVVRVAHSGGLALIPPVPHSQHGQQSSGLRVLDESWRDNSYAVTLEGRIGDDSIIEILDQSRIAASIKGARVMARDGDHLILAVPFVGEKAQGSYVRKEIIVKT